MMRYSLGRLAQLVLMLFIASVVIFTVIQNAPGDPARIQLGLSATPEQIAVERERLGLDEPVTDRYVVWLSDALRLDLGNSFATNQPVTELVGTALSYTARLAVLATLIALVVGGILGIVAALNRGRRIDVVISTVAAAGLTLPSFALGAIFILVVAVELQLLPPSGAGTPGQPVGEALKYLIMPAVTLAIPFSVILTRFIRVALAEAMEQDFIVTARAKGLTRRTVILQHGLRNAMIPTITMAGIQVGRLLAGAVVVETVFSYPGLGFLTIQSIRGLDYPVVEGSLLLAAGIFLVVTFLVDLTYGLVDPRGRLGGR